MTMRLCPFRGCGRTIAAHLFGCPKHWHSLTKSQQARIYEIYGQWRHGKIDGKELRQLQQIVLDQVQGATP